MKPNRELHRNSVFAGLVLGLFILAFAGRANANVYATNLRINGGTTNLVTAPTNAITITYVLNEPASLGTTVQILSGTNVVLSLPFPAEGQGTLRGFNSVTWDGLGVPSGIYSISVTAASSGYTNWTQITSDTTDVNTYAIDGRGIAVDRNPASLYYGRIFVANSSLGPSPSTTPGDTLGILKFNADTSDAEEGISSADLDGHLWAGGDVSPWKLEVSADDYVYVDDMANGGDIYRWDPTVSSNSLLHVLRQDNQLTGSALSGPSIIGTGTNTQIWMVDTNSTAVLKWLVNTNFVCASNDVGVIVAANASASHFFDVDLDTNGNIYTCAHVTASGNPSPRVFRYRAYDPSTNGNMPEATPDWAVGAGNDTYAGASGIAVDPTGTYVAVAFEGPAGPFSTNGNTKILWATNGTLAANLDLGVAMQGDANHDNTDCAWDAVGNVYYTDVYFGRWRAFSPPGTNQATTVALASIQVVGTGPAIPPQIKNISVAGGVVTIDFSAGTNDIASAFHVVGAVNVAGTYLPVSGASITSSGPGQFRATFPVGNDLYFRIARQGTTPPPSQPSFTKIGVSSQNIVLTLAGNAADSASAFTLLSSSAPNGSFLPAGNAIFTQISPGLFQAMVPVNGPAQYYRIRR
jgi:hypothetical protein